VINNPDQVTASITQIHKDFGKIDIFVANGVPWTAGPLIDAKGHDEWNKVVDIGLNDVLLRKGDSQEFP
jgi:sorbose reductase